MCVYVLSIALILPLNASFFFLIFSFTLLCSVFDSVGYRKHIVNGFYWFIIMICKDYSLILIWIFFVSLFTLAEKLYSNGLLKDAINSRSICMQSVRFSHDRPSNDGNTNKTETSANASNEKVNRRLYFGP